MVFRKTHKTFLGSAFVKIALAFLLLWQSMLHTDMGLSHSQAQLKLGELFSVFPELRTQSIAKILCTSTLTGDGKAPSSLSCHSCAASTVFQASAACLVSFASSIPSSFPSLSYQGFNKAIIHWLRPPTQAPPAS